MGFIGSLLCALFISVPLSDFISTFLEQRFLIRLEFVRWGLAGMIILALLVWLFLFRRPLRVYNGRHGAMKANVKILALKAPRDRLKKYILSTRVSFWPIIEDAAPRNEFRELLTQKIKEGFRVQRIWQIHNADDLKRLELYLEKYKTYDNYSVKCFVGKSAFIPEVLSFCGRVVSVSIPQSEDPRRLTTAFHFFGRGEIKRWEDYFKILWEQSAPIKIENHIYY